MGRSLLLGVLGGLGPMSSVYFYELLTRHTEASSDQEHLDIIISSHATTPDRTGYILGSQEENPLPVMAEDAKKLEAYGADVIAIPCNTAHYFYNEIRSAVSVPVLNIIEETAEVASSCGAKTVGILATDGTVRTDTYQKVCSRHGIRCVVPDDVHQKMLMDIIYGEIKQGSAPDMDRFGRVSDFLRNAGCERLILGCTELSLIKRDFGLGDDYLDSLEALAYRTIVFCGRNHAGFPDCFKRCRGPEEL